jgi:hypothetical protein
LALMGPLAPEAAPFARRCAEAAFAADRKGCVRLSVRAACGASWRMRGFARGIRASSPCLSTPV